MAHDSYTETRAPRCARLAILLTLTTGITTSACLQPKDGACILSGGDYACSSSQTCILPRSAIRDFPGDQYGCHSFEDSKSRPELPLDDAPEGMIRIPFGLPKRFESSFDGDLDSVEGVLTAVAQEQDLDITDCDLKELRPTWSKLSEFVRDHLDRKGRVRVSSIVLDDTRIKWIEEFNGEVRNWLSAECVTTLANTETGGTGSADGTGSVGTASDSDDSTTGLPVPCGQDNGECPESMPFCDPVTEQCVRCDDMPEPDAACAEVDATNPLCVEGSCVACIDGNPAACDAQGLLCDINTMACVPCAEHAECPSGACDLLLETPTCFDPAHVLDVGANRKYQQISDALTFVNAMKLDRAVLRLHESGDGVDFDESIVLTAPNAIAFIATNGDSPLWTRTGAMSGAMLSVSGTDTRVYIDGVSLSNSTSLLGPGFVCNDGSAIDIRRSRIVQNENGGIRATSGCTLHVQNCFVGGDAFDANAIEINDNTTLDMLYTTVIAGSGSSSALQCSRASTVTVRNSILVSENSVDEISCVDANFISNATNTNKSGSSTTVGLFHSSWFVDYSAGDFSLNLTGGNNGQVFANIATWQPGDPTTDIHGDPRPNTEGPDYPGADVP